MNEGTVEEIRLFLFYNGNVLKTIDAKGNTISETVYNSLNKPASVTDAMGKTTTYTYTALGKVESVVDSLNNRQEFTYDSMGRNTVVRDANNGISTAQYDTLGNITSLSGPLGRTILKSDILEKFSILVLTNVKNSDILVYK